MNMDKITLVYQFKKNRLSQLDEQTRSHDFEASCTIRDCFLGYGWSSSELLGSNTKVMAILNPYLQPEGLHIDDGLGNFDRRGASAARPNHHFPATSLNQFSLDSNDFDPAPSSGIYNTVESISGWNPSHLTFGARDGTRDPATMGSLGDAINSSIDPTTEGILSYTVNSQHEFIDPAAERIFDYAINNSYNITDFNTDDLLQSTHDQSMNTLSNYETDPLVEEQLLWTVHESAAVTDPSTRSVLQRAASPNQIYLMNISQTWLRSTDNGQFDGNWYTEQS
jgi:hypothetical protein